MHRCWSRLTNPVREELIVWFESETAGTLHYDLLHSVPEDALTK